MSKEPAELLLEVETLQNMLLSHATGGSAGIVEYQRVRRKLMADTQVKTKLPRFVYTCRDLDQFWSFIKAKFRTYKERREYIWSEFRKLIDGLENETGSPADDSASDVLATVSSEHVHTAWQKALDRRGTDPEGAITAARTLLESVCKHILDELGVPYSDSLELPKLYRAAANELKLAPSQHTEQVFKQILEGCQAVVEGLGAVRNKLSDSHGGGKSRVRPLPRHAELAVNLAGAMATFLVSTLEAHAEK